MGLACLQVYPSSIVVPRSSISPLVPANYLRYPSLLPYSASNNARVICSACSCDDDFFCAFNCGKCSTPSFCSSGSCIAASGPAQGKKCIFPFIYNGVQYNGCAPLDSVGGLVNLYSSPIFWCSTMVDVNGFHVRGPYDNKGKHVGFCDNTCPKITRSFYF